MAPGKTRVIGIFANSACAGSLTLRKSDRPLSPKAVIQVARFNRFSTATFGHKQTPEEMTRRNANRVSCRKIFGKKALTG